MKIYAVSTSKKHSTVQGKNKVLVGSMPLYAYNIMYAHAASSVSGVYVSTDDEEILNAAGAYGFTAIQRPSHLCTDTCTHDGINRHALEFIENHVAQEIDALLVLFGNTLTAFPHDIDEAARLLAEDDEADSVATVCRYNMFNPYRACQLSEGYLTPFLPKEVDEGRNRHGDFYFMNGSLYLIRRDYILNKDPDDPFVFGRKVIPLVQQDAMELDEEWQIKYMKFLGDFHGVRR